MALDATELADIRDTTGANTTTEFSDAKIQAQYDLAVTNAPDSTLILPYTYAYILQRLWGIRSIAVDRYTDHGDHEIRSQIRDATEKLLKYWESRAGFSGGALRAGVLDLNINWNDGDEDVVEQD